ncbi:MAG: hypothetical protein ACK4YP_00950 [Myxococcota bacterium]
MSDWYPTVTPAEHMDSERSSVYPLATPEVRRRVARGEHVTIDARTLAGPNAGWPAVTRDPGELFLLHGSLAFKGFDGAQVTKVDTRSWTIAWKTRLIDTAATGEWNYPGSIGAHADGFLYAVYGYRLARIDPATGAVLATVDLPTGQAPKDTTYNGFVALPDGNLVGKSLYRMPGCKENGFRALARGGVVDTPSDLPVIDPRTMRVVSNVKAPEHLLGRITSAVHRGETYVYAAGKDRIFRYRYADGALALDPTWGPVPYRQPGETPGSAITAADGWIFIQGNAGPAPVPFTIHAISQDDATRVHRVQPFPGRPASFNASKLTYDAANRRMYTTDGLIGKLACYDFDAQRGFTLRWVVDQGSYSFLVLVGPPEERVLLATELRDTWWTWLVRTKLSRFVPWLAYLIGKERVLWRDPDTGALLAASPELPPGLAIIPGFDGVVYYPTMFEGVVELTPRAV